MSSSFQNTWSDDEEKFVDQPLPNDDPDINKDLDTQAPNISEDKTVSGLVDEIEQTPNANAEINGFKGSWVHRVNFGGSGRNTFFPIFNLFFFSLKL